MELIHDFRLLRKKRGICTVCDLAVLPLGHPLCAVHVPICRAVQCHWECALPLFGNSCAC